MQFTIRKAKKADMPEAYLLIKELAAFENQPDAVKIKVDDLEREGFKSPPSFEVFLAVKDDEVLGMALFYPRFSTWEGVSLHLEDLIVHEKYRGNGIGKALYTKVLQSAVDLGYRRVSWDVLDWNTNAIEFYESTGATVFKNWCIAQIENEVLLNYVKQQSNR